MSSRHTIVIPVLNQLAYTRQCVESLVRHGCDMTRVVAVDNASSDDTRSYLESIPGIHRRTRTLWPSATVSIGASMISGWPIEPAWT